MTDTKPKTVTVRNVIDAMQLRKDVSYSLTDLSNAMQEQAGLHQHYAELSAQAARQVDDLELAIEVAESRVYRQIRDKYLEEKVKITEALLDREVSTHATVIALKRALNEAKQIAAVAKGAVLSFQQRRDMLIQHGAKDRVEMAGELRISGAIAESAARAERMEKVLKRQSEMREKA